MKKKYLPLLLAFFCAGTATAQTLTQARRWFENGEFEKARPVFRKLVKQDPSNANYNFWYGACCYEGGDLEEARPYLEKSAARKVINAYLYLGRLYCDTYRFDEAVENMEQHIYWLEKKDRNTEAAERELAHCRMAARMFRATEKVVVVDSFVVSKPDFLSAYKLSKDAGEIVADENGKNVQFVNELGNKKIYVVPGEQGSALWSSFRLIDKWGDPEKLRGIEGQNPDYPFLAADGITLYYAAEGEESLGKYDIFVTRYDSDSNEYLRPDNMGMPFNSPYNDYMYVVDDYNNLGWFVSDRYQPEGKVCVYVFVPNASKEVYDYENTDPEKLAATATLKEIRTTWTDEDKVRIAKQTLAQLMYGDNDAKRRKDFVFVVNDNTVYDQLSDFSSKKAREQYQQLAQKNKDLEDLQETLQRLREKYAAALEATRQQMTPGMRDMERRIEGLRKEVASLEVKVRNTEIQSWGRNK